MGVARLAILALAAVAAGIAAFLVQGLISGKGDKEPTAKQDLSVTEVLVASQDLTLGKQVAAADLRWQPWPEAALTPAYVVKSKDAKALEDAVGAIVRQSMLAGEPVTSGKIIKADSASFMAALLTPGMRAISVKISAETGAGGFILPNDRVDVLLTQEDAAGGGRSGAHFSRTILTNVRVLAIDQTFREEGDKRVVVGKTATLELVPHQAEVLAQSEATGTVSLALRSLADFEASKDAEGQGSGSVTVLRYGATSRVGVTSVIAEPKAAEKAATEEASE